MLDGKKHLVIKTKQHQKLEFKDDDPKVLNGWKDQIMTFKKDSMHLELTELQMNSEVRPCRSTSIKSSKSVVVARRISREDYATLSNGSDVLMVPYLSKRKSVSMSTLPRFEVWNEERSNRFSISSTDSKFSTGIRSRTCSKASRSSRMKRPIIPIQSQNLMTLHGRCSHSSENINVVPMEVSTFDKLSVQSAQFVRASRESDLVVTPEASHSAELTFHSNALDFDDTIDVGANNSSLPPKAQKSQRSMKPPSAQGRPSKKPIGESFMRKTSGSISSALKRISLSRAQSVNETRAGLRESRKQMISSPVDPRKIREDPRISHVFSETAAVKVLPSPVQIKAKDTNDNRQSTFSFDDAILTDQLSAGPKLKRKGSARIVERVKSLPRNILKLASGKSFDDKQPLKDDKPTIKDEPQSRPKLVKQDSLVSPDNEELQTKLRKWKQSADTSSPVNPVDGLHWREKPPLPEKSLNFKQRQLKNLIDGKIQPPPNKRWPKYAILDLHDKACFELKAIQRHQDREELNKLYDCPRRISSIDLSDV
ncbi:uncharacterized protein LOC131881107 isoform X2 [Tigriopus californicus]|nr:uncharacterized protein LOC131881107 isoform X2 [Tigriopus californicus]